MNINQDDNSDSILNGNKEINSNKSINESTTPIKKDAARGVEDGLGVTIGKKEAEIKKKFGEPNRVDRSAYGYDWWIYKRNEDSYFQLAMENGKVVSAYGIGDEVNISPFKIGQPIDQIYSSVYVEPSVDIEENGSSYRFELSEEDMNMRPIVELGDIYVQLYLDKFTGTLSSV